MPVIFALLYGTFFKSINKEDHLINGTMRNWLIIIQVILPIIIGIISYIIESIF